MKILGISDSKTESGIAFYEDGVLKYALNEERVSRIKVDGSFPYKSLDLFYNEFCKELDLIDYVVFAGIYTPTPISRLFSFLVDIDKNSNKSAIGNLYRNFEYFITYKLKLLASIVPDKKKNIFTIHLLKKILKRKLHPKLQTKKIYLVDHHMCHASSAFFSSGFNEALMVSLDGFGDGASGKIYLCNDKRIKQVLSIDALDSFGLYYSLITEFMGFTPEKHEGKVTGLAAYGNAEKVKEKFPFEFGKDKKPKYKGRGGIKGLKDVKRIFSKYKKEDVASWLQTNVENMICEMVSYYMVKYNQSNVCLAGGLTCNVKINQKIHELKQIEKIYIYPAMSDMGLSHGAILSLTKKKEIIDKVYYGPKYTDEDIESVLISSFLRYRRIKNIENKIAELLAKGKIVARFNGEMEYGPRALGNRSILVQATDKSINDSLNKKLKRTEFMPFAPTILDKFAKKCIIGMDGAELTSKFMNISFKVTDYMKKNCPAAVHVDNTARPQILSKKDNESYYKILSEYNKITGLPAILNTSFNVHEEPIVMTPEDAVKGFKKAKLDYLAIGNFLVEQSDS